MKWIKEPNILDDGCTPCPFLGCCCVLYCKRNILCNPALPLAWIYLFIVMWHFKEIPRSSITALNRIQCWKRIDIIGEIFNMFKKGERQNSCQVKIKQCSGLLQKSYSLLFNFDLALHYFSDWDISKEARTNKCLPLRAKHCKLL